MTVSHPVFSEARQWTQRHYGEQEQRTISINGVVIDLKYPSCRSEFVDQFRGSQEVSQIQVDWSLGTQFEGRRLGECESSDVLSIPENALVVHRDFVAGQKNTHDFELISSAESHDGFFNFLRWLLPLHFLQNSQLVMHSSAVSWNEHCAALFLGPSGAGKTTWAELAPANGVLGDDMNTISETSEGSWQASLCQLGQSVPSLISPESTFELQFLFWLKQGDSVSFQKLNRSTSLRHLLSSVANLFWPELSEQQVLKLQQLLSRLCEKVPMYELTFPKREGVWNEFLEKLPMLKL